MGEAGVDIVMCFLCLTRKHKCFDTISCQPVMDGKHNRSEIKIERHRREGERKRERDREL